MSKRQHRYPRKDIPPGQPFVLENCEFCGAVSRRYSTGFRMYFDEEGRKAKFSTSCSGKDMTVPPEVQNVVKIVGAGLNEITAPENKTVPDEKQKPLQEIDAFKIDPKITKSLSTYLLTKDKKGGLIDVEARLKDAMLLVRLLYEDVVKNNINSNARQMAGRYLYSNGHEELVKYLNNKQQ